jgi:hypothetical protein
VQTIVQLALESPGELAMLDFARLKQELIGMDLDADGLEPNFHLDSIRGGMRIEIEKRMLVSPKLSLYLFEEITHSKCHPALGLNLVPPREWICVARRDS